MAKDKTEKENQEWPAAMEELEKCMLEGMQEICDKMAKKLNDKMMKNMKNLVLSEVGKLKKMRN